MAICNSCGGIIGRDCFNPSECELITNRIENEKNNQYKSRISELEERVKQLEKQLENT